MNIGANIRRLRIEKELTQDKLAGMIGITPQAVSKWEREEGLPDITLLPAIAAALDCSTDELLGVGDKPSQEELAAVMKTAMELVYGDWSEEALKNPNPDAGLEYLRPQLEKYPTEWALRVNFANLLGFSLQIGGYDEGKLRELVEHYEYIYTKAPDMNTRFMYMRNLASAYADLGELEKAKELAMEIPNVGLLSSSDIAILYRRGDELREMLRYGIVAAVMEIRKNVAYLTNGIRTGYGELITDHVGSIDERLEMVELGVNACELLKNCEWGVAWKTFAVSELCRGATILMEEGQPERALDYIERAVGYCRPVPGEKEGYLALGLIGTYGNGEKIIPSRDAQKLMLGAIEQAETTPEEPMHALVDHPRWKALKEKIEKM